MKYTKIFKEISKDNVDVAGGKGASLGEMIQNKIPVPDGFVVLSKAFDKFLENIDLNVEIDSILHKVEQKKIHTVDDASEQIQSLILNAKISEELSNEILNSFKELNTKYVAVRSSATAEDSVDAAWAGQLDTFLNTTGEDLLENVKKCWASLFTPRAIFYRHEKNLHGSHISVAVVIQEMVESETSGVAFSVHPVTQDYNQLIIEGSYGLGEAIVSGQVTPDSYVVEKEPRRIIDKNIYTQEKGLFKSEKGGNEWKDIPKEKAEKSVLTDKQILELSEIILTIENHYGFPCDIEWAFTKDKFYITQSRPITTLGGERTENKSDLILVKENSRDYSLFGVSAYFDVIDRLEKETGFKPKNVLQIRNPKTGLMDSYIDTQERKRTFESIGKKATDKKFIDKTMKNLQKSLSEIHPYFEGKKNVKNKNDLKKLYKLFIAYYGDMSYTWVIPNLPDVPEYLRDIALKAREETEKYSSKRDELFGRNLKILYPKMGKLVHFLHPRDVFDKNNTIENLIKIAQERSKGYLFFRQELVVEPYINDFLIKNKIKLSDGAEQNKDGEITGSVAFKGVAKGVVRLVFNKSDIKKIGVGDVLVSPMTRPEFLPAMKKAIAFVTDEGGITCHAAIVSRELKKPCVIGTKIATQILKDGMKVEVDADNGVVKVLERKNEVKTLEQEINLDKYEDYQRLFQWKGGGLPFLFTDIYMETYKKLDCICLLADGVWTNFLPRKIIEKTLEEGFRMIKDNKKFDLFKKQFDEYKEENITLLNKILEKEKKTKSDIKKALNSLAKAFHFYSKTEFFYTDKAFDYSKKDKNIKKNLGQFDEIKNGGRAYINKIFLEENNPLDRLILGLSERFSISRSELKTYSMEEIFKLYDNEKLEENVIKDRQHAYIFQGVDKITYTTCGEKAKNKIENFYSQTDNAEGKTLRGTITNKGKIIGKAKVLHYGYDDFHTLKSMIEEMDKGDILVAESTSPELIAACKKAGAIITNQGGLMSHAAIISREMNIPCIVGLGNVTQILKDGMKVEVDADKGIVKILD